VVRLLQVIGHDVCQLEGVLRLPVEVVRRPAVSRLRGAGALEAPLAAEVARSADVEQAVASAVRRSRLRPVDQRQGRQVASTKARVGEPWSSPDRQQQAHVGARRRHIRRDAQSHTREQRPNFHAECAQGIGVKPVVLKAISAPATADELVVDACRVDPNAAAERDIEVLEPDGRAVRALEQGHAVARHRG